MTSRRVLNAVKQNQTNIKRVNVLAQQEVLSLFRISKDETDLNTIKLVRDSVPAIVERYGTVAATTAAIHYDELRDIAFESSRVPAYVATATALTYADRVNTLLDYGIASNFTNNRQKMATVLFNGVTGIVSQYNRDAIQVNSERDSQVGLITVQRVAEPGACAFCAMIAVNDITYTGIQADAAIITYEDNYHDNCNCSVEVIFEGQEPIRPPYYNKMEEIYKEASDKLVSDGQAVAETQGYSDRGNREFLKNNKEYAFVAENITRYMREIGGLK
jgi:hypothetical protein